MITFNKSLKVILPIEDNDGNKVDYTDSLKEAVKAFGGYTLRECKGGWLDNDTLYTDTSNELELIYPFMDGSKTKAVRAILSYLFNEGGQLAVFVTIGQGSAILEPSDLNEFINLLGAG